MSISTSECSESGWTTYLDSYSSPSRSKNRPGKGQSVAVHANHDDQEDDEGLSMVSDATSGPPHFDKNNAAPLPSSVSDSRKKSKQRNARSKEVENCLSLDDTASSPIFHYSQDNVAPSKNRDSTIHSAARRFEAAVGRGRSNKNS